MGGFFVGKSMKFGLEQCILSSAYRIAVRLRNTYWLVTRPKLIGVRVLIVEHDAVLLVRHRAGRRPWSLPGGGVKGGERLVDAAAREAREETGVEVRMVYLHGVFDNFHHNTTNCITVFVAVPLNPPHIRHSLEIAEARYFPLDALPDGLEHGSRRRIAEYVARQRGVTGMWWEDEVSG
jgi:ADP-ribose pyrophosphatase YjhB (NUDIX family)